MSDQTTGLFSAPTIDGVDLLGMPRTMQAIPRLLQTVDETMSGRKRLDIHYQGDKLPDVLDAWEFIIEYGIDSQYLALATQLEELRTDGAVHEMAFWKKRPYRWTATAGQTSFYLPRPDAFSKGWAGHTDQSLWGATVKVNGVSKSVAYKASVTEASTVTPEDVWISNTAVTHPSSGGRVALFKFASAPGVGAKVVVEYYPLFRVVVTDVATAPFDRVGDEDKTLMIAEVA